MKAHQCLLLEISERFGWDNEDKAGWSKVNFELLGTSKGRRLPRTVGNFGENNNGGREDKEVKKVKAGEGVLGAKRRERPRFKKEGEKLRNKHKSWGGFDGGGGGGGGGGGDGGVRVERNEGFDKDEAVEINNLFPAREALSIGQDRDSC